MDATTQVLLGLILLVVFIVISKSIKIPKANTAQAIMLFGQLHTGIENIPKKKFDDELELVDLSAKEEKPLNIYFFLWPIFKTYTYKFSYTKSMKLKEAMATNEIIAWKDESSGDCIVIRRGTSDHFKYRVEYPSVTAGLDTKELATVNVITTHVITLKNLSKAFFGIDNWFIATMSKLDATLKGLVSKKNLLLLNRFSSEDIGKFSSTMLSVNKDETTLLTGEVIPGLENYGVELFQSTFRDFEPSDEPTRGLMEAHLNVSVFSAQGKANLAKQKGDTEAYRIKTNVEIEQEKKRRVQTGVAKTDAAGNITELVPDANVKISAEALATLAKLQGTLVLGEGTTTQMLNITKK